MKEKETKFIKVAGGMGEFRDSNDRCYLPADTMHESLLNTIDSMLFIHGLEIFISECDWGNTILITIDKREK